MLIRPIRRVLFIYPPDRALKGFFRANVPPLGAACLAAYVRERADVAILDAKCEGYDRVTADGAFDVYGLSMDEIESRIRTFKPDAVGLTCLASFNWPEVMEIAKRAKAVDPEILTVAGGTHPAFLPEQSLSECPELDIIVRGEGERTIAGLIEAGEKNRIPGDLAGLAFRDGDRVEVRPFPEPIVDLDSLPYPARDLLDIEKYFKTRAPFSRIFRHERNTSIQTSRGCPAKCVFCSSARFWGHAYRARSPESTLDEMELLIEQYGVKELQFVDDNLIFDRGRAVKIFEAMIDRKLDLEWCMPNGVALWRLDVELLRLMKKAGCYSLTLAFESGNQRVLSRVIKKPLHLSRVNPLVAEMKKLGLSIHAFFISGFPGETKDEMWDTYKLAESLDLDGAYFFIATPLPGTELCQEGVEKGHLPGKLDFTKIEFNKGHFNTDEWSAEDVEKLTGAFYLRFMLSAFKKHPVRFLKNYGRVIISKPWYVLEHLAVFVKRWVKEVLGGDSHAAD